MNVVQRAIMKKVAKGFAPMMRGMLAMSGALSKAFYERYGKEALPIITEVMSKSGVESGKIMQQMMPVRDMKGFGEQFNMMGSMMEMGMETIELSDEAFHFKVSQCPFGIEGTSRELCEALMTSDVKRVGTLLGQEMEAKILKTVAAGDEKCEVILSKK